jgi:hypothetical protein
MHSLRARGLAYCFVASVKCGTGRVAPISPGVSAADDLAPKTDERHVPS